MRRCFFLVSAGALLLACDDDTTAGAADPDTGGGEDTTAEVEPTPDVIAEEVGPEVSPPTGPVANVYRVAPGISESLEQVTLAHLDEPHDVLTGAYARVQSCTPDLERGKRTELSFGPSTVEIVSCVPEAKARPGEDGTYLHITPPATPADDDGRFAEVMMYHHMQVIHDYYKDVYGLTFRDHPLDALTNVTTWIDRCDAWTGVSNAVFVPREALGYFVEGLDVSSIQGDAIMFSGTADKNFAFDASVIYHEYTHAMVGATRLSGVFLDDQGINAMPSALNEAYADYFAATQTGEPTVGMYALNDLAASDFCGLTEEDAATENYARDLRAVRRCPDDLVSESHADSEIFSSALWAIRETFGALQADTIVLYAALELTDESDFDSAAEMTIQGARDLYGEEVGTTVEAIFAERNLVSCNRVIPIEKVGSRDIEQRVEGTRVFDPNPFPGYVPGYVQFSLVVPEGTQRAIVKLDATAGGFSSNGQPLEVDAVIKLGAEPVTYTYGLGAGTAAHDGDLVATIATDKTFVIQNPNNVPLRAGPWTFALHNKARRTLRISGISATFE